MSRERSRESTATGATPLEREAGEGGNASIDAPRQTPQGRTSPDASGSAATAPGGEGAAKGQPDKAEG